MAEQETELTAYAYLLRCADGTLYAGWTWDPDRRLAQHNKGKGAKYTRGRLPVTLLRAWPFASQTEAMQFELWLKSLSRAQKLRVVSADAAVLKEARSQ